MGSEVADEAFNLEWYPLVPSDCAGLFQPTPNGHIQVQQSRTLVNLAPTRRRGLWASRVMVVA